ncbi:MAG: hypothetical protein NXI04_17170 [Planctomycetaceae bacterium]|nr:hypothetical protein [Planctomycetaceae bacterium]
MSFETHLTIDAGSSDSCGTLEIARVWAVQHNIKWTHIQLDRGAFASQPMLTFWGNGRLAEQKARGQAVADELAQQSIRVVRHKIETTLAADNCVEPGLYFECHVKLQLNDERQHHTARQIAARHNAHLSRNARRQEADGCQQRFLTLRQYTGVGRDLLGAQERLCGDLQSSQIVVLEVESERVVFDSHLQLDEGWET